MSGIDKKALDRWITSTPEEAYPHLHECICCHSSHRDCLLEFYYPDEDCDYKVPDGQFHSCGRKEGDPIPDWNHRNSGGTTDV